MEDLERIGIPLNNMPELPEVETVKNVLSKIVIGHKILSIEIFRPQQIDGDATTFKNTLEGNTFISLSRIGKYLIFHLTNNLVIISHLRMEGKYFEYLENEENSKYCKVVFHLDNNHKLCYDDSRCFGILKLSNEDEYLLLPELKKLGPEPFNANPQIIHNQTRKNKNKIKTALLDQTLMTGLGNIYVDETLYRSHIHPHTKTYLITLEEWKTIVENSCKVLSRAIELGGSTIKSYHPGKDIDGNFQTEIKIYGKSGNSCEKCGKTYLFCKTNGRGTTFCPGCQKKKGTPINVGLTGVIASGKSTVLELFKTHGYETISSDEIVINLYKKDEVIHKINKSFNLSFEHEVDHKVLRDYLLTHPKDKKRLENIIHPLVKKDIINILSSSKSEIRIVEVPLLFKAHFEDLFDTLIVVDVNEETQLNRLKHRNKDAAILMQEINKGNMVKENINKAEFIIQNNGNKEELKKEIEGIIYTLQPRLG